MAFDVGNGQYAVLDEYQGAQFFCDSMKAGYFSDFLWTDWTCQKYVSCMGQYTQILRKTVVNWKSLESVDILDSQVSND